MSGQSFPWSTWATWSKSIFTWGGDLAGGTAGGLITGGILLVFSLLAFIESRKSNSLTTELPGGNRLFFLELLWGFLVSLRINGFG